MKDFRSIPSSQGRQIAVAIALVAIFLGERALTSYLGNALNAPWLWFLDALFLCVLIGVPAYLVFVRPLRRKLQDHEFTLHELRENGQRFSNLINNFRDIFWSRDSEGLVTFLSPTVEAVLGYPAELFHRSDIPAWISKIHVEDRDLVQNAYVGLMQTGQSYDLEYRFQSETGEWVWLHDRGWRTHDEKGHARFEGAISDISRLKHNELKLAEQSQLVDAIFENSQSCNVILDRDFNFIRVNAAYASADNRKPEDFPGRNHFEFYPSEAREIFEQVVRSKQPVEVTARPFRYADHPERGVTYWDWKLLPMLDSQGDVDKLVFTLSNVTERYRAEEQLRRVNAYHRSLIEASVDPFLTIDLDGKVTDVNCAAEVVTGYGRDKLIGTDCWVYVTEPEKAKEGYLRTFREGKLHEFPLEIRHRDGHTTPVLFNAAVYRDHEGKVAGIFAVARDITELKQVGELHARLAAIVEFSDEAIAGGELDGTITSWNRGAEKIYGYSPDEILHRSALILIPNGVREEFRTAIEKVRKGESVFLTDTKRLRKDGSTVSVSVVLSPIRDAERNRHGNLDDRS